MSDKQFINDLSATYANVRRLDAKKINLKGKNILEYLGSSSANIKHAQDTRETVTENDLWGQWIETLEDGTIVVHDDEVANPNVYGYESWNTSITKVEANKAYVGEAGDTFFANIQTEKIKDGYYMFGSCSNLTSFRGDLSSMTSGYYMFDNCSNLTSFSSELPSLTGGDAMFNNCSNLTSFSSNLPSLTNGWHMFNNCSQLKSFSYDLSSLTNGEHMFRWCSNLTSFSSELPSLTNGPTMFGGCENLTSFSTNLPNLTGGFYMFSFCENLTTFSSELPSLTNGEYMFHNCSNLTSFSSNLSSLTNGNSMFSGCKLDAESVMYVVDTIKDITAEKQLYINGTIPYVTYSNSIKEYSAPKGFMRDGDYVYTYNTPKPITITIDASYVGKLTLGINVTNDSSTIQQQLEDFAKEATFDSWEELKQTFVDKGWTVTFQYGGTETSIAYGLREGERIIPCPIFAKLVQVEDKDSAEYCTEDGASFYNIDWGHDVTDTSSYTQFDSLEDAMASWNVFPKENIISSEAEAQ